MTERTDRELMELAAKAARLKTDFEVNEYRLSLDPPQFGLWVEDVEGLVQTCWHPLDEDGPALRLAVTLDIAIEPRSDRSETEACTWVSIPGGMETIRRTVPHGDDPGAATRRAIVLVAAALWEQIQATRAAMAGGDQ